MSDIIDHATGRWVEDAVKEIFHPIDADIILGMRLSDTSTNDELIWFFSKNGIFTVKTAYNMWMDFVFSASSAEPSEPREM